MLKARALAAQTAAAQQVADDVREIRESFERIDARLDAMLRADAPSAPAKPPSGPARRPKTEG